MENSIDRRMCCSVCVLGQNRIKTELTLQTLTLVVTSTGYMGFTAQWEYYIMARTVSNRL